MANDDGGPTRVRNVAAAFLIVTGFTLALAAAHPVPPAASAPSSSAWVPSMHEAEAGLDVGPGSDEALLVSSPTQD